MFEQVKDLYLDGLLAHIKRGFSEAEFVAAFGILSLKAATLPDDVACTPEATGGDALFLCRF